MPREIIGRIDTAGNSGRLLFAQVRGLKRLAGVGADGSFAFRDLPGGKLAIRIVAAGAASNAHELSGVSCRSGETAVVAISTRSRFSEFRRVDTILTNQHLAGAITGFPLLVRLDASSFDFSQAREDGGDIFFAGTNGAALPFEIEQWNVAAREAAIWVRLDTIHGNGYDQQVIMHWGGAESDRRSDGASVFDTAQGFAGVWHLDENPSGAGAIKDRTANGYHGTASGSMTSNNMSAGMIGAPPPCYPRTAFDRRTQR